MRMSLFTATGKVEESAPFVGDPSDLPEALDLELPPAPAIMGVRGRRLLWMIGGLALALRLLLIPLGHGWDLTIDYNMFVDLAKNVSPYDTFHYLSHIARAAQWDTIYEYYAYPPVPLYIYWPLAKIYHVLHPNAQYFIPVMRSNAVPNLSPDFFFLLKLPIWIADFLIAALLARMSGTVRGFRDYLLNPYVLMVSGAWTFDAIMILGLVAGIYFVYRNKLFWSAVALAFGTAVKFFPIIAVPTVLIYLIKKKRPFKEIIIFLVTYVAATLLFFGPFLGGVIDVATFHGNRPGGGMTWQVIFVSPLLFPAGTDLRPIIDSLSVFGTPMLAIALLLSYWYIWWKDMTLNRMVIVTLAGFFVGTKLINEQYALLIFPFIWLEAYHLQGAWRWIYRLFWMIPVAYAAIHVPVSHFFLLAYHMLWKNQAGITNANVTGLDWSMFPWEHPGINAHLLAALALAFFGLALVTLFWPVRWPKRFQNAPANQNQPEVQHELDQKTEYSDPFSGVAEGQIPVEVQFPIEIEGTLG
jgi:hypothetical protein